MTEKRFKAMGCTVRVLRESDAPLAGLPEWFEAREAVLSRFRPDSALSRLNAQSDRAVAVEPLLWNALDLALRAAAWSGGLVTPTVGEALVRAGYDRDFELLAATGTDGASPPLPRVTSVPDWRAIVRNATARTVRLPAGTQLDLGGTVKGALADELARALGEHAPVLVDVGGDLAVSGPREGGEPWPVAVADPRRPSAQLEVLALSSGGVATSGRDYRRWPGGHHLIDPRTGAPAVTDVLSATVVAGAALTAEVAAKVAVLLGAVNGLSWLDARGLAGLTVGADGTVQKNARFEALTWS